MFSECVWQHYVNGSLVHFVNRIRIIAVRLTRCDLISIHTSAVDSRVTNDS